MRFTTTRTTGNPKLTVSLCLAIDHVPYAITPIRAEDPDIIRAFRLNKKGGDGAVYDVAEHALHGLRCDCPDWTFRRDGLDPNGCKHLRACVMMGLLEAAGSTAKAAKGIATGNTLCCPASEAAPCMACVPPPTPADAILAHGTALAEAEVNRPLALPDRYEDEAPEVTEDHFHDDEEFDLPERMDPWSAELPNELWDDDTDADTWELGPAPDPVPSLDLAGLIDRQADAFRAWPVDAGRLLAETLEALATRVRLTDATTPDEYRGRADELDLIARETWEAAGYTAGLQAGRREAQPAGTGFGHSA